MSQLAVTLDGDRADERVNVLFKYNEALKDLVKQIQGRRFDGDNKLWHCPREELGNLVELLESEGVRVNYGGISLQQDHFEGLVSPLCIRNVFLHHRRSLSCVLPPPNFDLPVISTGKFDQAGKWGSQARQRTHVQILCSPVKLTTAITLQADEKRDMIPTLCDKDYDKKLANITADIWDKLFP